MQMLPDPNELIYIFVGKGLRQNVNRMRDTTTAHYTFEYSVAMDLL